MIPIDWDLPLVEAVVFLETRALAAGVGTRLARRIDRDRERIYDSPDAEAREAAARDFHRRVFASLELQRPVVAAWKEVGGALERADALFVARARAAREEGGDLHRKDGPGRDERRSVVLRVRAERWRDLPGLARFLRHELQLVADLLDPSFGAPRVAPLGTGRAPVRLEQARLALLWGASVDGRLARRGLEGRRPRDAWRADFERAFGFLTESAREASFERLFAGDRPAHGELLAIAADPRAALDGSATQGREGTLCALCRMPAFDWHPDPSELPEPVLARVRRSFPSWTPADGACRECLDRYALATMA